MGASVNLAENGQEAVDILRIMMKVIMIYINGCTDAGTFGGDDSEIRKAGDRFSSNKKAVKNESETIHLSQPFWRLVLKAICLFSVSFLCSMRYQRHQKLLLGHWLLRHQSLLV